MFIQILLTSTLKDTKPFGKSYAKSVTSIDGCHNMPQTLICSLQELLLTIGRHGNSIVMTSITVLIQIAVIERRSWLMPNAEVPGSRGRASRWFLTLYTRRTRRSSKDIGNHKPGPMGHGGRSITQTSVQTIIIIPWV